MFKLVLKKVSFNSDMDEISFFRWIESIEPVLALRGFSDEYHLLMGEKNIPDDSLRELIALFHRYSADMTQLAQFLTAENSVWFKDNEQAFWKQAVFKEAQYA